MAKKRHREGSPGGRVLWAHQPLTGFGLRGRILLAMAVSLAVPMALGFDYEFALLQLVADLFGVDVMMEFTVRYVQMKLALWTAGFGPIALIGALLAIGIGPRRRGWWLMPSLVLANLLTVFAVVMVIHFRIFINGRLGLTNDAALSILVLICSAAAGLAMWLWSGSRVLAGLYAAVGMLGVAEWMDAPGGFLLLEDPFITSWGVISYALTLAVPAWWATRERRRGMPVGICMACGYNLGGLTQGPLCPECGAVNGEADGATPGPARRRGHRRRAPEP